MAGEEWIGNLLGFGLLLIVLIVVVTAGFGLYWLYMNWRRYKEFRVVVWENDGFGHLQENYDEAGIFIDRATNNKRLFLKKYNVGLNADKIPYVPCAQGIKKVYLVRDGLKNFRFIKPEIEGQFMDFSVGEEDVNWGLNSYERGKRIYSKNTLLQYLPWIVMGLVCVIILIIFIYFFREFAVLKDVALAFKDAAGQMAQMKTGVITG